MWDIKKNDLLIKAEISFCIKVSVKRTISLPHLKTWLDQKIILLGHQNNYVRHLMCKHVAANSFIILVNKLNIRYNVLNGST
jgi:hypothetical protein